MADTIHDAKTHLREGVRAKRSKHAKRDSLAAALPQGLAE